jgi:hypothetical protein
MNASTIAIPTMLMSALSAATCGGGRAAQRTQVAAEAAGTANASASAEPGREREGSYDTLKWDGKATSLEVRTMNGAVRAALSHDDRAHVVAHVLHRERNPPLRLKAIQRGTVTLICVAADRPKDEDEPNDDEPCAVSDRSGGALTELEVRVPKGVKLASWTMNGSVDAERLEGEVEAHTQNGVVRIETTGIARASTVNGSIRAKLGATSWDGTVTLETVNGQLDVELPKGVAGRLNADTVQGSVRVTLPMSATKIDETHVEGQMGKGGGELRLRTVNGRIEVR